MKYLSFVFLFSLTIATHAELKPLEDVQLAEISGQANISDSAKENLQIGLNSDLLQPFALLSQILLNNPQEQTVQLTQPQAETWAQTTTTLALSSIPFFGFLFMLGNQSDNQ
jgi:hypothetical protein